MNSQLKIIKKDFTTIDTGLFFLANLIPASLILTSIYYLLQNPKIHQLFSDKMAFFMFLSCGIFIVSMLGTVYLLYFKTNASMRLLKRLTQTDTYQLRLKVDAYFKIATSTSEPFTN
jgi:hypothetical protein